VAPLATGGTSPRQPTDSTWVVLFGVASVKVTIPHSCWIAVCMCVCLYLSCVFCYFVVFLLPCYTRCIKITIFRYNCHCRHNRSSRREAVTAYRLVLTNSLVLTNPNHVLTSLLPNKTDQRYYLQARRHDFQRGPLGVAKLIKGDIKFYDI